MEKDNVTFDSTTRARLERGVGGASTSDIKVALAVIDALAAEVKRLTAERNSEQERHANTKRYVERALGDERMAEATREMHESGNQSLPGIYVIAIQHVIRELADETARATAAEQRVERLRAVLVEACNAIPGAMCDKSVSDEFLTYIPEEMRLYAAKAARVLARTCEKRKAAEARLREVEAERDETIRGRDAVAVLLSQAEQTAAALREALARIEAIDNSYAGGDWDEIDAAREIARAALHGQAGGVSMDTIDTSEAAESTNSEPESHVRVYGASE